MSNFIFKQSQLRTIRQDDPSFMLNDGLVVSPRAGFEIGHGCPEEYKMIINQCISLGWLKPVATVYDHELTWNILSK